MNKNIFITAILAITLFASCKKENDDVNYTPNVKIQFSEGGDANIVTVAKGVLTYNMKANISGSGAVIRLVELYNADIKTGNRGSLISSQEFPTATDSYTSTYTVPALTDNKAIKVVVTDTKSQVYEKNILIKITPAVIFSDAVQMETVENYYGPYFANWLSGRVYMRNTPYASEIDFSLGDVAIPVGAATKTSALVNPALRTDNGLLTAAGLQATKFALTTLTAANYTAITKVDATPITGIADPTLDVVALQAGKVYLFKTANGKKGLINVTSVIPKTGTIENLSGKWETANYSEVTLTTKVVAQ